MTSTNTIKRLARALALLTVGVCYGLTASAVPYKLSYRARLVDTAGVPIKGPIDVQIKFFRVSQGGDAINVSVPEFKEQALTDGFVILEIALESSEWHSVFPDGSDEVWVELTDKTNNQVYPRQQFLPVPYALKVPVDAKTVSYTDAGQLKLNAPNPIAGAGQFLTTDTAGNLIWAAPVAVSVSEKDPNVNALGKATLSCSMNEIPKWNGTNWACGVDISGGTFVESDPITKSFAKTTLPTCASGYYLKGDGTSLSCVQELDPITKSFAKTTLPTCAAGQVLKGDGSALSCVDVPKIGSIATSGNLCTSDGSQIVCGHSSTDFDINGGAIDATPVGASSASSGSFTTVSVATSLASPSISLTQSANSITLAPPSLSASSNYTLPPSAPSNEGVLRSNSSGTMSWGYPFSDYGFWENTGTTTFGTSESDAKVWTFSPTLTGVVEIHFVLSAQMPVSGDVDVQNINCFIQITDSGGTAIKSAASDQMENTSGSSERGSATCVWIGEVSSLSAINLRWSSSDNNVRNYRSHALYKFYPKAD